MTLGQNAEPAREFEVGQIFDISHAPGPVFKNILGNSICLIYLQYTDIWYNRGSFYQDQGKYGIKVAENGRTEQ
jgi:hypothetical protein